MVGRLGERPPRRGAAALRCHNKNNSIGVASDSEVEKCVEGLSDAARKHWQKMTTAHRKSTYALRVSTREFINRYGLEKCLFVTLTFPSIGGKAPTVKEASRRFNSLATNLLNGRGLVVAWIRVLERGERKGRVHYHCLVAVREDVRTGFDFEAFKRKDYTSANGALRAVWAWWRKNAKKYGFGRVESQPLRSTDEAVAQYLSKYISAHITQRKAEDKGARLVGYSKGVPSSSSKFAFDSVRGQLHRRKLAILAGALGFTESHYSEQFRRDYGRSWMYWLGPHIKRIVLPVYPTFAHLCADFEEWRDHPDEVARTNGVEFTAEALVRAHRESLERALAACRSLFDRERLGRAGECNTYHHEGPIFVPARHWKPQELLEVPPPVWRD